MPVAIAAISGILDLIEKGAGLYNQLATAARQSGELTPDQEAAFRQRMQTAFASAGWQPDQPANG
jgi:hypothetical protein